uniref:Uncharacterized protein n=1 Tax=Meloidogyne enterolobii TaxID=390850 RepID=A0A6V7XKV6_MELEN|nr:unnamed protein product [Meloidogyne enterolobii]
MQIELAKGTTALLITNCSSYQVIEAIASNTPFLCLLIKTISSIFLKLYKFHLNIKLKIIILENRQVTKMNVLSILIILSN